jgi:hypothetical protein
VHPFPLPASPLSRDSSPAFPPSAPSGGRSRRWRRTARQARAQERGAGSARPGTGVALGAVQAWRRSGDGSGAARVALGAAQAWRRSESRRVCGRWSGAARPGPTAPATAGGVAVQALHPPILHPSRTPRGPDPAR